MSHVAAADTYLYLIRCVCETPHCPLLFLYHFIRIFSPKSILCSVPVLFCFLLINGRSVQNRRRPLGLGVYKYMAGDQ